VGTIKKWSYLRRMIADGPRDQLDVETTVAETAHRGCWLLWIFWIDCGP